ncbi:MAG TPA: hypothetical protein VD997_07090 [Phycisphaerales bacterium]|nr:hypothetical protein [Phycisphaerales bacterium]
MARRKTNRKTAQGLLGRVRVLVVSTSRERRDALASRLDSLGSHSPSACDVDTARAMLNESFYDVVMIGDHAGDALSAVPELNAADRCVSCIVVAEPSMEMAVKVMRAGGVDLVDLGCTDAELCAAIKSAGQRARRLRARARLEERRARKLRSACRELNRSRHSLMDQLGSVCNDMAASYRDLSEQMKQVALASELNTIFRQELDLECLLRTVLEYTLKKIGPTNAAIFLPAQSGDFTLGAYVNYDCPRDTAETLLDHLADIMAPAFEGRDDVAVMRGLKDVRPEPGPAGAWLEDSAVAAFSCRVDGECLAVVVLFRDRRTPFTGSAPATLRIIKDLFAQQLSRIVKMNYRHLPKHQWGGFFKDEDERGMAA